MAYNNFGMPGYGYNSMPQSINALENQLYQLKNMAGQIQSPIPNQSQPLQNGVSQIGTYVVVKTVQDMENYPAPVDGTPINIFIENMGVFYSKKMINGTVSCQPFSFSPLNTVKTEEPQSNINNQQQSNETPEWALDLLDRVYALEEKVTSPQKRQYTKRKTDEVDNNGN